jgi:hypothetical protein
MQKVQNLEQPSMIDTKPRRPLTRSRRHRVELLDFREGDIDRRLALRFALGDQLRQAVQGLRAEHDIDVRRAGDDGFALLAGDAAADADHQVRIQLLQVLDPAEVVENLLLRLLAHRAGVEQDDVGFFRVVGLDDTFGGIEHVGHLVRVVLVHLAPESADEQFFWHGITLKISGCRGNRAAGEKAHYNRPVR